MAENSALTSTVGLLAHLSIEELKEVLHDDDKFENITKDANIAAKNIGTAEREMLIASNKSLAEFNLSRSEEFMEKKTQVADLYEELRQMHAAIEEKISKIKELSKKTDSEGVLALLQAAASESERETDEISERLLDGSIKLETFLDQYPSRRKLMHMRKAKVEKMTEMISRRLSYKGAPVTPRITTITQSRVTNVYPPNYSNAPVSVPYPLEPSNMPLPNMYMPNHF